MVSEWGRLAVCAAVVCTAAGASVPPGGTGVAVDHCQGMPPLSATLHTVYQALPDRTVTVPSFIRASSGEQSPGCTRLVAPTDGAVHLLLGCPPAFHNNATVSSSLLEASIPGLVVRAIPGSSCLVIALDLEADFRQAVELAANLPLALDALVLPHSMSPPAANVVANAAALGQRERAMATKDEVVRGVSDEAGYYSLLEQLSGAKEVKLPDGTDWTIKTRNTYQTVQSLVAAEWVADWFTTEANLEVSLREFTCCGGTTARNVVARLQGSGAGADEVVVVGAHMDSLPTGDLAPGAVDNGSGTVGLLLMAREFAKHSWNRTIEFVAFGAEEQGIHGSAAYVQQSAADGVHIVSALCMDMIAYSNRYFGVTIEGTSNAAIQELMRVVEGNTKEYSADLQVRLTDNSFGSDHVSFQRAGIPAILAIELDDTNYPHYHRATDTVAQTTPKQAVDIVKGLAATLVDLAGED